MQVTVENPRGSVEKLSPKDSVEGAYTVLRGSARAPEGFYEGKPKAAKSRGRSPQVFAAMGLPIFTVKKMICQSVGLCLNLIN